MNVSPELYLFSECNSVRIGQNIQNEVLLERSIFGPSILLEKSEGSMDLSAAIPRGGGWVTPETYAGMERNLSTLFANFKPGMGGLDRFCTFVAGEDPRDFYIFVYYFCFYIFFGRKLRFFLC